MVNERNYISKNSVKNGYGKGIVKIVDSPHEDGAVCSIGDNWFYFGGMTAEEMTAEEYVKNIPVENIIDEIFSVLEEILYEDEDEYNYYFCILLENNCIEENEYR